MKGLTRIKGQPSWRIACGNVEAAVTALGGHLSPIRFRLPHTVFEPFSIAPWAEEKSARKLSPLFRALRGDFFCAPFGGNETPYRGERHPVHGESANAVWKLESAVQSKAGAHLHLSLRTRVRQGRVDKVIRLRPKENAIYCRHVVAGMTGKMSLGHHATLRFPDRPASGVVSTSPVRFAQVLPVPFENPAAGGYSSLRPGGTFTRLDRVPLATGGTTDLSRYPARRGFEDLVMVVHEAKPDFAWSAVTFPERRCVWFALKDPRALRSTVLWISNGGRHYAPWNGRHLNVMGVEDVTAYFHLGLAESARPNPISRRGFPTCVNLSAAEPFTVNYIMAAAAIPRGWKRVENITRNPRGGVTLHSTGSKRVAVALDLEFLYGKGP